MSQEFGTIDDKMLQDMKSVKDTLSLNIVTIDGSQRKRILNGFHILQHFVINGSKLLRHG
jgi:hypothetical protein